MHGTCEVKQISFEGTSKGKLVRRKVDNKRTLKEGCHKDIYVCDMNDTANADITRVVLLATACSIPRYEAKDKVQRMKTDQLASPVAPDSSC